MSDNYKPTTKMPAPSASGYNESFSSAESDQREYNPTMRMGSGSAAAYGPGGASQTVPTLKLNHEPPSFAWLVLIEGVHAGHIFNLYPDSTVIGRESSCDIVIDDPAISRQHAKIRVLEGEDKKKHFVLYDLATENGTLLNGEEIDRHELQDGDEILIGHTRLVFKQVQL